MKIGTDTAPYIIVLAPLKFTHSQYTLFEQFHCQYGIQTLFSQEVQAEGAAEGTVASLASGNNFVFTFAIIKLEYFRHFCLQLFTNLAVKVLPAWQNVFILNAGKSFISFFWLVLQ